MNRNDITIAVTESVDVKGEHDVWIVQGFTRAKNFTDRVVAREDELYFSQVAHRVVAKDSEGGIVVVTPTEAKKNKWEVVFEVGYRRFSTGYNHIGTF